MMDAQVMEWAATVTGVIGAIIVASNTSMSKYGWIAFLTSSLTCSIFAYMSELWGLLTLQLVFILTNLLGLWRWLVQPYLEKNRLKKDSKVAVE